LSTRQVDIINIGLISLSFFLAFKLPFELFIFSYIVLGPLHYLTELNWLKKNNYFIRDGKWIWIFVFMCLIISIPSLLKLPIINNYRDQAIFKDLSKIIHNVFNEIVLIMFLFAIGLVSFRKWQAILLWLLASVVVGFFIIKYVPLSLIVAGLFLPTIIHVYMFTLLFMIYGTLNSKNKEGMIGIILLLLCPLIILIIHITPSDYNISDYTRTTYLASKFSNLSSKMAQILQPFENKTFFYLSEIGIKIQIFIAFCYTYHYLNWFSKTSIIGWSKSLSKTKIIIVFTIWIGSVLLYLYNPKIGFSALFFLSILHVVLEFPLNIMSIKGIMRRVNSL